MKGNVKRWFIFALVLCAAMLMGCVAPGEVANAGEYDGKMNDGFVYTLDEGQSKFTIAPGEGYKGSDTISAFNGVNNIKRFDALKQQYDLYFDESSVKIIDRNNIGLFKDLYYLYSVHSSANSVGNNTFNSCSRLKYVSLGEVESIGANAFSDCPNLSTVQMQSLVSIGEGAFENDTSLEDVVVPTHRKKNLTIGKKAFYGCVALTDQSHNDLFGVVYNDEHDSRQVVVGDYAFYGDELEHITIPNNTIIGDYAYANNTSLKQISLIGVDDYTYGFSEFHIGANAFRGCAALEKLSFNESHICDFSYFIIGESAFQGLKNLTTFDTYCGEDWDGSDELCYMYIIGDYAFADCEKLEYVRFETGNIGKEAFRNCVSLPDKYANLAMSTATAIGERAFQNCTRLKYITIPTGVELGSGVFQGCTGLTSASIGETQNASNTKSNGDEGTTIGANVFEGCTSLTSIVLGDDIASIDENAFTGLSDDLLITFKGTAEQLKQLATGKLAELNWVSNDSKLYTKIAERTFEVGETISVDLSTDEAQKRILAASHFDWDVQPRGAVSVNSGKITFLQAGDITVTASLKTNSSIQLQLTFHVEGEPETIVPVARIRLKAAKREISLKKDGKKFKLTAKVFPANATNTQLSWSSSNRKVATVSRKGVVTFKKKGNVTITATSKSNPEVQASILFKVVK